MKKLLASKDDSFFVCKNQRIRMGLTVHLSNQVARQRSCPLFIYKEGFVCKKDERLGKAAVGGWILESLSERSLHLLFGDTLYQYRLGFIES